MIPNLSGLTFDTACGRWRTEYIGEPKESGDNIDYYIRFKWVDPHEPENKATPERRLRLLIHHTQVASDDFPVRFERALLLWLDSDETDVIFEYDSALFRLRDRS